MKEKIRCPVIEGKRITVLGAGNLGGLLAKKLAGVEGICRVIATGKSPEKLQAFGKKGIEISTDNVHAVQDADIILLCVKPQKMKEVVEEICRHVQGKLVVSVAAGVPLRYLEKELAGAAIVRCMPNLCASIGMSQTAIATNRKNGEVQVAREMLSLLGKTHEVQEKQIAVWTSVCASGPAFLVRAAARGMEDAQLLPCMQEALCREGFGEAQAAQIAQDVLFSTKELMQKSSAGAAEFVKKVASRKGTTRAGIKAWGREFNEDGLASAFEAAKNRAMEIENAFS